MNNQQTVEDVMHIGPKLKVAAHLLQHTPDKLWEYRPSFADGKFSYSLCEIYAHLADARNHFISRYIEGEEWGWLVSPPADYPMGDWKRSVETLDRALVRKSLQDSFERVETVLRQPASCLQEPTANGQARFQEDLASKQAGQFSWLTVIPLGSPVRSDIFTLLLAHEWRHIGGLFMLLRQQEVNIPPM